MRTMDDWWAQYSNSFFSRQSNLSSSDVSKTPSLLHNTMRWLGVTALIGSSWRQPRLRTTSRILSESGFFGWFPARCCLATARRRAFSSVVLILSGTKEGFRGLFHKGGWLRLGSWRGGVVDCLSKGVAGLCVEGPPGSRIRILFFMRP